jgi:hypothetical protein
MHYALQSGKTNIRQTGKRMKGAQTRRSVPGGLGVAACGGAEHTRLVKATQCQDAIRDGSYLARPVPELCWQGGPSAHRNRFGAYSRFWRRLTPPLKRSTTRIWWPKPAFWTAAAFTEWYGHYANVPDSGTVLQSLKPFPQYGGVGSTWAPLGASWYDALQVKTTKRFSHGLDATLSYAFSKTLNNHAGAGDLTKRSTFKSLDAGDRPHLLTISINYTTEPIGFMKTNRIARTLLAGWSIGSVLQYQSGPLLGTPGSNNSLNTYLPGYSTRQFRVPGAPLYLKDINGSIDPTQDVVLNPAAWSDQAPGVFGTGTAYWSDFRGKRRPVESASIGKRFSIKEHVALSIQAEFFNVFNRNEAVSDPSTGSPSNPPTRDNLGRLTGGFGYMNYTAVTSNSVGGTLPAPRMGQIVARNPVLAALTEAGRCPRAPARSLYFYLGRTIWQCRS